MGCKDCGSAGGCGERKGAERELLDGILARIYPPAGSPPVRTWGLPDDEARFQAGVPRAEVRRLVGALATVAQAPTFFEPGEDADLCDFVWILCVGRRPSLLEQREEGVASVGDEMEPGVSVEEKYLRVAFSSVARIAAVQEVTLALAAPDETADSESRLILRETPRPGVFDPILLARMRKIVSRLQEAAIAHIDFGLLDRPVADASPGDYVDRYGIEPRLCNFLFQSAPATAARITTLARPAPDRPPARRPARP